jgi:hypothetical protein
MIGSFAFYNCSCLRNLAFPTNAVFGDKIFIELVGAISDLQQLFGMEETIIRELRHRFDELPIHSIVYYQSYNQGVLQILIAAINMRSCQSRTLRSKLDPSGNQQDCLGMSPLHILACSSVQDLELYRLLVEKYPANLITEDRWGALPLLYAFWGDAPAEIIDFLLESYQALYPDYEFNWTMMVETMGRCETPKERIKNLLHVRQLHFPEQPIDWEYLLNEFVKPSDFSLRVALFQERMHFLFTCGLSFCVEALAFKVWRDHIENMMDTVNFKWNRDNSDILRRIRDIIAHYKDKLPKLKEATTILEIALWKIRLDDENGRKRGTPHRLKKYKSDELDIRRQCRVTCGADVIIGHVLPFLV